MSLDRLIASLVGEGATKVRRAAGAPTRARSVRSSITTQRERDATDLTRRDDKSMESARRSVRSAARSARGMNSALDGVGEKLRALSERQGGREYQPGMRAAFGLPTRAAHSKIRMDDFRVQPKPLEWWRDDEGLVKGVAAPRSLDEAIAQYNTITPDYDEPLTKETLLQQLMNSLVGVRGVQAPRLVLPAPRPSAGALPAPSRAVMGELMPPPAPPAPRQLGAGPPPPGRVFEMPPVYDKIEPWMWQYSPRLGGR